MSQSWNEVERVKQKALSRDKVKQDKVKQMLKMMFSKMVSKGNYCQHY